MVIPLNKDIPTGANVGWETKHLGGERLGGQKTERQKTARGANDQGWGGGKRPGGKKPRTIISICVEQLGSESTFKYFGLIL